MSKPKKAAPPAKRGKVQPAKASQPKGKSINQLLKDYKRKPVAPIAARPSAPVDRPKVKPAPTQTEEAISSFIVKSLSPDHRHFLEEDYYNRPGSYKTVSGAVRQILSKFPQLERQLSMERDARRKWEKIARDYASSARRLQVAADDQVQALKDLQSFITTAPVDPELFRQLSILDETN